MIEHPLFSFSELTEEELIEKTGELHRQINRAFTWGSSAELINQLQWMLEMIEEERGERNKRAAFEATQAMFPATVESDPEFKSDRPETQSDSSSKVVKPASKKAANLPAPSFTKQYSDPKAQK